MPTEGTLAQHVVGRRHGLVPAGDPILSLPNGTEYISVADIQSNQDLRSIDTRLREVARNMAAAGYSVAGLDAAQIGEDARVALVPHPTEKSAMFTIINGAIEDHPDAALGPIVPHGCHSGNETFTKLRFPESHTLRGYDMHGEPIELERTGFAAIVDRHELLHEAGLRAPDIGLRSGSQLDWRPPELKDEYRAFFDGPDGYGQNPNLPDWHLAYPPDQWEAVRIGDFVLMHFVE
jgi:peptide deformylase